MRYYVTMQVQEVSVREKVFVVDTGFTDDDDIFESAIENGACVSDTMVECLDVQVEEFRVEEVPVGNKL